MPRIGVPRNPFQPLTEEQIQDQTRKELKRNLTIANDMLKGLSVPDVILRDQFASYAIACAAWGDETHLPKEMAKRAYALADAMLKERKRTTT
jgi:hypothetical protein